MSLQVSFTIESECDCSSLTFTETTGSYNAGTNTGGYGAPNPTTGDVTSAVLIITNQTTNTTYDEINITPSSSNGTTTITPADIQLTEFADGAYCFTYNVTINSIVYTYNICKLLLCNVTCKIKTVAGTLLDTCNHCKYDDYTKLFELMALYNALKSAANCSNYNQITNILSVLNNKLDNITCKNC